MKQKCPRLLLAGTGSGCGKTTVTAAVLQALVNSGKKVAAFKCGPDYIDPMFHREITGSSSNLDLFLFDQNTAKYLINENSRGKDIAIIEGVMGYYDGVGAVSDRASSYDLAKKTDTPVVLIVGAKGAALSVLAVIEGFLNFRSPDKIAGVILNRCTKSTFELIAPLIRERFGGRIALLGFLPEVKAAELKSRHLGLVTAQEISDIKEKLAALASAAEQFIDMASLMRLALSAEDIELEPIEPVRFERPVKIAVARDRAFCFYYEDNLRLLSKMGAELLYFSPMSDSELLHGIDGLYLGGGYPELYARELYDNASMRASIKKTLENKIPCIAECGGFIYLTEEVSGYPMVGFIKGKSFDTGRLTRFGYITLTAENDNMLCKKGERIAAHEFHRFDSDFCGSSFTAKKASGREWKCVFADERLYAGYPHLNFYSRPEIAENFYRACLKGESHAGIYRT